MPLFMAALLWIAIDITGIFIPIDNTGHLAHLSGIFFGFILGLAFKIKKAKDKIPKVQINEESMRHWESRWMRKRE
jgi:membrane associated rhomboid family serine protease